MNRSELAAIIAQTMHSPTRHSHVAPTVTETINPPLSPKQVFQSHVRTLNRRPSHEQVDARSAPINLPRDAIKSHELQHVSTLRVKHGRICSTITSSNSRTPLADASNNVQRFQSRDLIENVVPDFSAEECEAWSRKSPKL